MWEDKIVLKQGEILEHESSKTKGFMAETDTDEYSIVDPDGSNTGSVTISDHTAVKGFKRTIRVV